MEERYSVQMSNTREDDNSIDYKVEFISQMGKLSNSSSVRYFFKFSPRRSATLMIESFMNYEMKSARVTSVPLHQGARKVCL